jgi:bifunctional non-homologous end joining protein LigD
MSPARRLEVDGRSVRVTNLDKVLYPDDGTTKHDVLVHYLSVASVILPQLAAGR